MNQRLYSFVAKLSSSKASLFISLSWILGIVLGALLALRLKEYAVSLIGIADNYRVTILGLLVVVLLPVSISLIACKLKALYPIYLFIWCKGICFGYSVPAMLWSYGRAAWLLHFLLSFSSMLTLIPMFCLWLSICSTDRTLAVKHIILIFIFSFFVGLIDYFLVSPGVLTL